MPCALGVMVQCHGFVKFMALNHSSYHGSPLLLVHPGHHLKTTFVQESRVRQQTLTHVADVQQGHFKMVLEDVHTAKQVNFRAQRAIIRKP